MLGRAIEVILSLNEDRDFFYRDNYTSDRLARDIVDYVIARRTSIEQNRIYHTTELLNIPSITRELFYGPGPEEIPEEGLETAAGFLLQKDEFGDLSATYIYDSDQEFFREQEADALSGLMEAFPGGHYGLIPNICPFNHAMFQKKCIQGKRAPPPSIAAAVGTEL